MASSQWNAECWMCQFPLADFYKLDGIPGAVCPLCGWNWDGLAGDNRPHKAVLNLARTLVPRIVGILSTERRLILARFFSEDWHGDFKSLIKVLDQLENGAVEVIEKAT